MLFQAAIHNQDGSWFTSVVAEGPHRGRHAFFVVIDRLVSRVADQNCIFSRCLHDRIGWTCFGCLTQGLLSAGKIKYRYLRRGHVTLRQLHHRHYLATLRADISEAIGERNLVRAVPNIRSLNNTVGGRVEYVDKVFRWIWDKAESS